MKKLWLLIFIVNTALYSQTDWMRWDEANITYEIGKPVSAQSTSAHKSNDAGILDLTKTFYQLLISDHDGYNCPFHPTCSEFFVQSVAETNIFQGILMFADRFTRDTNLFKSKNHYPLHITGKFYDPVDYYQLSEENINYIPSNLVVK